MQFGRRLFLLFTAFWLAACSGHSSLPSNVSETFTTVIHDNGTKVFAYNLALGQEISALSALDYQQGFTDGRRLYSPEELVKRNRRRLKSRLNSLLEDNNFCREGFITLQQYAGYATASLRGECREGASDEDRQRFPNGAKLP